MSHQITKREYKALKRADALAFDFISGVSDIRAIKKGYNADQTVRIACDTSLINYGVDVDKKIYRGYVYRGAAQRDYELKTMRRLGKSQRLG